MSTTLDQDFQDSQRLNQENPSLPSEQSSLFPKAEGIEPVSSPTSSTPKKASLVRKKTATSLGKSKPLPAPVVKLVTFSTLGLVAAILGTAFTFTLTYKHKSLPVASSFEPTLKLPQVDPGALSTVPDSLMPSSLLGKETLIPPKSLLDSSLDIKNSLITPQPSHSLLSQRLFTPPRGQQGKQSQPQTANKRSPAQPTQTVASNQQTQPLQTSSQLSLITAIALELTQTLQAQSPTPESAAIAQAALPTAQQSKLIVDIAQNQNQHEATAQVQDVQLALSDVVILALENNRSSKNAYLERIVQRQDLAVAEDEFVPNVSVSIGQLQTDTTATDANVDLGTTVSVKIPTGGQLKFSWATNSQTSNSNELSLDTNDNLAQNIQLGFNQPLLRGAGDRVNRAPVEIARLTEQTNILELKSTLINTITDAVLAYRELLRAQERLKLAQASLQSAQELLDITRTLIEAGRRAPVDIVQSETDVANRRASLIEAENNLQKTRLALLNFLNLEQAIIPIASEIPTVSPVSLDPEKLQQLAFTNQLSYLQSQLNAERTKMASVQAENNQRWDVNLNTSVNNASTSDTSAVRVGLGSLTVERDFQPSRVNPLQAENSLTERRDRLEIQLTDKIKAVNLSFSQLEQAKQATELSTRQLEVAQQKQQLEREDTTIFEIIRLQNDLVQARNDELDATISYLNALTQLDQILGTTLDTWQVTIEREPSVSSGNEVSQS